jgi:hypothetical protein
MSVPLSSRCVANECRVPGNAELRWQPGIIVGEMALFSGLRLGILEPLEKGHQLVARAVTARLLFVGRGFGKRLLFESEAGVEIDLNSFHRLMTEPKSNDRAVNTALQQLHCEAVAKDVRGDTLGRKRRTDLSRNRDVLCQEILDPISAHRSAAGVLKPTRLQEVNYFKPFKCLSGWRKALRVALADNPVVKGEGLSPKTRRELLGHSQMTLGLQLVLTTSRKTIFSPI